MITILFVSADPSNGGRLQLEKELREIQQSLRLSKLEHRFKLEHSPATRPHDFIQAMIDFSPDIVHFSGHGSDGAIWLENDIGEASPVSAHDLDLMFAQFKAKTSCVVLNACSSRLQAEAIAPHARHVIGTRKEIGDDAAIGFSRGFYRGLGSGRDVPDAFDLGRPSMGDASSQWVMMLDTNPDGVPLDLRFASHLPVVVAMGCTSEEFRSMMRDALQVMAKYDFSEDLYRDSDLSREDYSIYKPEWLLADPEEWKQFAYQGSRRIIANFCSKVSGPKVYHFFVRAPICFALAIGACIGTKHEIVIHHHQPGSDDSSYVPVIDVSARAAGDQGAHLVRLRPKGEPVHILVEPPDPAKRKLYASLAFAPTQPTGVKDLARKDHAGFVAIRSKSGGNIPLNADWLLIAREVNTALLDLLAGGCSELHLFPSVPVPLAFAIGMGLDTRCPVVVHQWYSTEVGYREVFRLNELGKPGDQ